MGHTWEVHRTYYRHYDSIGERQEAHRSPVMSSHVIDRAFWPNRLQAAAEVEYPILITLYST